MSAQEDPFAPVDPTFPRPRPGAGRPGPSMGGHGGKPPRGGAGPDGDDASMPHPGPLPDYLGYGRSPLLHCASQVLLLAGQLRATLKQSDVVGLRQHTLGEIYAFEERAHARGIRPETITGARYALCAAVDEAVLSTPWGGESDWAQHSLLLELHGEAQGGEKFFDVLDGISAQPTRHVDLMELYYVCLVLGFAGKYEAIDRGPTKLAALQHDLFGRIRSERGAQPESLSPQWEGLEDRRNPIFKYRMWRAWGGVAAGILGVAFVFYWDSLQTTADPILGRLALVGRNVHILDRPPATETPGPTLRQLLAERERRGDLSFEEGGGHTRVILRAADLFASGRADLNAAHVPLLQDIGDALNLVPGTVLVEGHTDSEPINTPRYPNNRALSEDRARRVAERLTSFLERPDRVDFIGRGTSVPRKTPGTAPENRRVELVHTLAGGL